MIALLHSLMWTSLSLHPLPGSFLLQDTVLWSKAPSKLRFTGNKMTLPEEWGNSKPSKLHQRRLGMGCTMAGGKQARTSMWLCHRILASGSERPLHTAVADEGFGFCILRAYFLLVLQSAATSEQFKCKNNRNVKCIQSHLGNGEQAQFPKPSSHLKM